MYDISRFCYTYLYQVIELKLTLGPLLFGGKPNKFLRTVTLFGCFGRIADGSVVKLALLSIVLNAKVSGRLPGLSALGVEDVGGPFNLLKDPKNEEVATEESVRSDEGVGGPRTLQKNTIFRYSKNR